MVSQKIRRSKGIVKCQAWVIIEPGKVTKDELAQTCTEEKERLQQVKAEAEELLCSKDVDMADPRVVQDCLNDMRDLLAKSSITEQRSFLKSFVEKIEVGDAEVKMYYTIPMPPKSLAEETVGVIPLYTTVEGEGDKGSEVDS